MRSSHLATSCSCSLEGIFRRRSWLCYLIVCFCCSIFFFFSSRRRHTRCSRDWSSDVCSSDLGTIPMTHESAIRWIFSSGGALLLMSQPGRARGGQDGQVGTLNVRPPRRVS